MKIPVEIYQIPYSSKSLNATVLKKYVDALWKLLFAGILKGKINC